MIWPLHHKVRTKTLVRRELKDGVKKMLVRWELKDGVKKTLVRWELKDGVRILLRQHISWCG